MVKNKALSRIPLCSPHFDASEGKEGKESRREKTHTCSERMRGQLRDFVRLCIVRPFTLSQGGEKKKRKKEKGGEKGDKG